MGELIFEDVYYKCRIWLILHIFILRVNTFTKRRKRKLHKAKVHLLRRHLPIYILFPSFLMLHIKFSILTKRCSRMTHNTCQAPGSLYYLTRKRCRFLSCSIDWLIALCFTLYRRSSSHIIEYQLRFLISWKIQQQRAFSKVFQQKGMCILTHLDSVFRKLINLKQMLTLC